MKTKRIVTRHALRALACGMALAATADVVRAVVPEAQTLTDVPPAELMSVENGSVEAVETNGAPIWRWHVNAGQTSILAVRRNHLLSDRLRYYDRLQLDYRIASGEINSFMLNAVGNVSGIRQYKVHNFRIAIVTTPRGVWHSAELDLAVPYWFPWDNPDGEGEDGYFRFEAMGLAPDTVIEIRDARLLRGRLYVKPDFELPITWPVKSTNDDGSVAYTLSFRVLNTSGRPADITAAVRSRHTRFVVGLDTNRVPAKAAAMATFKLTATIGAADIAATPELYAEPLSVAFSLAERPEITSRWSGELVRPLTPGYRTQVIVSAADVAYLRQHLATNDMRLKRLIGYGPIIEAGEAFAAKRLLGIPRDYSHVNNAYPGPWRPGEMMPEAVNTETGEHRFGDRLAGKVWRDYLAYSGQAPYKAGLAYVLTGDEQFATNVVRLLELYAQQYTENPWYMLFDPPFMRGGPIQSSSRQASNSSYGSNWDFKWILEGLSLVSESAAWQQADRNAIYLGFVLPYATELAKLPGQISNQTDITNHNLLLLGLIFDDARLVYLALKRDCGLLPRLQDIDADGFSSEGRPLNYHGAAAAEYLPSVSHLVNSGLNVHVGLDRILAAIRMPYRRATLTGRVPNTGDCGRGMLVGNTPLADILIGVVPNEQWLADIGNDSTISAKLQRLRTGRTPVPDGWRKLIETGPTLFSHAGLAILRTGDTADDQIMATLDYGRSVFHGARDRNQITLCAFGKVFTHGPGSLYNAGSGGITFNDDPRMKSFISGAVSLSHNVVVVDAESQLPSVGELLAWSPDPDREVAVSRVVGIAPGVAHTRALILTRGILVVLDRIEAAEPHSFDLVYHNFGKLTLATGWESETVASLGDTGNYDNLIDPHRATGKGVLQATWDLSGQHMTGEQPTPLSLRFWQVAPVNSEVFTAVSALNNPNTGIMADQAPSVIRRILGQEVIVVTVLEPCRGASRITDVAPDGADGARIAFTDGRTVNLRLSDVLRVE